MKSIINSTRNFCTYALLACALVPAGCTRQSPAPVVVKVTDGALHIGQGRVANAMEVAEGVLVGMYFTIEKSDARSGIIRTRPLPGAQFFEFWRSDNIGADNTLAANIHTIRRTVTIDISQQGRQLRIGCNVHVQRMSIPERQVSSSARVYGMFSTSSRSLQRLQLNPEQKKQMAWIDLGPDPLLEAEILKRIKAQIIRRTNHLLHTTESKT